MGLLCFLCQYYTLDSGYCQYYTLAIENCQYYTLDS